MPIKDMATSTSTFGILRYEGNCRTYEADTIRRVLGATVGISIGQAIYSSVYWCSSVVDYSCANTLFLDFEKENSTHN